MRIFSLCFVGLMSSTTLFGAQLEPVTRFFNQTMAKIQALESTIKSKRALQMFYDYQEYDLEVKLKSYTEASPNLTQEQKEKAVHNLMKCLRDVVSFEQACLYLIVKNNIQFQKSLVEALEKNNLSSLSNEGEYSKNKPDWEKFLTVMNNFIHPLLVLHMNYNTYLHLNSPIYLRNTGRKEGYLADYTSFFYQHFLELAKLSLLKDPEFQVKKEKFAEPIKTLRFSASNENLEEKIHIFYAALKEFSRTIDTPRVDVMMTRLALKMISYLIFFDDSFPAEEVKQDQIIFYLERFSEPAFSFLDTQAHTLFQIQKEEGIAYSKKYPENSLNQVGLITKHQALLKKQEEYYLLYRMHMMCAMLSEPNVFDGVEHALQFRVLGRWLGMCGITVQQLHWGGNLTYDNAVSTQNPFAVEMMEFYNNHWFNTPEKDLLFSLKKNLLLVPDGDNPGVGVLLKGYEKLKKLPVYPGRKCRAGERTVNSVLAYNRLYEIYEVARAIAYGRGGILEKQSPIVTLFLIDSLHILLGEQFQNDWESQKAAYKEGQKRAQEMLIQNAVEQHERAIMSKELETEEGLAHFLKELKGDSAQKKQEKKESNPAKKGKKSAKKKDAKKPLVVKKPLEKPKATPPAPLLVVAPPPSIKPHVSQPKKKKKKRQRGKKKSFQMSAPVTTESIGIQPEECLPSPSQEYKEEMRITEAPKAMPQGKISVFARAQVRG